MHGALQRATQVAARRHPLGAGLGRGDRCERRRLGLVGDLGACLALAQVVERRVHGDAVDPGGEAGAAVEAVQGAVGAQEGLLHDVLGAGRVAGDAVGEVEDHASMTVHQGSEGVLVTRGSPPHQLQLELALLHPPH